MSDKIKVLIVDDSRIYRSLVEKSLAGEDNIEVIGSVMNGVKAIEFIENVAVPDVVTLDLEMPEMDGLQTLAAIHALNAKNAQMNIRCLMVSAFTQKGSETTMKALELGAFDFIGKPQTASASDNQKTLHSELVTKIALAMGQSPQRRATSSSSIAPSVSAPVTPPRPRAVVPSRKKPGSKIRAIVLGSSTGGPKALVSMLPELCQLTDLPILLVQHMPPTFTASLATSLDRKCDHSVIEVQGNEVIENGYVYVAQGGRHLILRKGDNGQLITAMNDQPLENGCRPAVDVLFRSAAAAYGSDVVAVVLTGMGSDGAKGLAPLKRAGAHIIVQDEATSVVWGMPGSAVEAGCADEILPLDEIAAAIARNCT